MAFKGVKAIVAGTSTTPHHLEVVDDLSGGVAEPVIAFGFQPAITGPTNDIWSGTAVTIPFPAQPGGEQVQVVSTSANDAAAGTGIQTLMIHYLDSSGDDLTETVTMNGVTNVNTVATNIRFINEIHTVTAGTGLSAAGTITVHKIGAAATVYSQIDAGRNNDQSSFFMVSVGKMLLIEQFTVSGANAQRAEVYLRSTDDEGMLLSPGIFHDKDSLIVQNSASSRNYPVPIIIPSLSMVKCTAFSPVNNADVQASYQGILVPIPD